jgi:hypothetical protein
LQKQISGRWLRWAKGFTPAAIVAVLTVIFTVSNNVTWATESEVGRYLSLPTMGSKRHEFEVRARKRFLELQKSPGKFSLQQRYEILEDCSEIFNLFAISHDYRWIDCENDISSRAEMLNILRLQAVDASDKRMLLSKYFYRKSLYRGANKLLDESNFSKALELLTLSQATFTEPLTTSEVEQKTLAAEMIEKCKAAIDKNTSIIAPASKKIDHE